MDVCFLTDHAHGSCTPSSGVRLITHALLAITVSVRATVVVAPFPNVGALSSLAARPEEAVIEHGDALGLGIGGPQGGLVAGAPTVASGQPEDEGPPLEAD